MTEKILPLHALEIIPPISAETLKKINTDIISENHYTAEVNGVTTILKPLSITYKSGLYNLNGFNYISNKTDEILLSFSEINDIDNPFLYQGPAFNNLSATPLEDSENEIIAVLNNADYSDNYIRIVYKNRNEVIAVRTLKDVTILPNIDNEPTYLQGYCYKRQENRTFRIDRIERLEILNIKYKKAV